MQRIKVPFAQNGDKTAIPDGITLDGSVNNTQGYTSRYDENPAPVEQGGSPTAKVVGRTDMNYILWKSEVNQKTWQEQTFPDWIEDDGDGLPYSYPKNAIVKYTDGNTYVSKIDNNKAIPTDTNNWVNFEDFGNLNINALPEKITPSDTDNLALQETGGLLKKVSFENLTKLNPNDSRVKTALNASGDAPIYANRAYVVFDGTNTPAIKNSGNISSIGDLGAGQYRINTAVNLPTNYGVIVDCARMSSLVHSPIFSNYVNKQSNLVDIYLTFGDRTALVDSSDITVNLIG